jgi:hypothetical protein
MKGFRMIMAAASAGLVFWCGPPAHAGGSTIEFPRWVVVGRTVTGHGVFGAGQQESVNAGPWFATLDSERDGFVPMRLGEVQIMPVEAGWRATVSFVVPDVPTGSYEIWITNEQGEGVGDLIGGWTVIAHTPLEGKLLARVQELAVRDRSHTHAIEALRDARVELRRDLAERNGRIGRQEDQIDAVTARSRALDAQLNAARADEVPVWPFLLAGVGTFLLAGIAFELGRRTGRYATRTLVTGASRSWTENHDDPESAEPKTSPLVAPK